MLFRADLMLKALVLNLVYFAVSVFVFMRLLEAARRHGSLIQTGE